ncbi:Calmodulin-like protein 12 [Orchesella cincta]|uniref:Calmodulin-like protein 12 n=1 Tax=Orchesella cincta TaxID=48709 RepID=A0A1D2NJQ3_ORCCI|nr:Calmodulin-like protein 12 [Orchesella cincta]
MNLQKSRQDWRFKLEPKVGYYVILFLCMIFLPCYITSEKVGHSSSGRSASRSGDEIVSNEFVDIDIVGFGEDCSEDGPFCDPNQHLACDPVEETCLCDKTEGYIHVNDLPIGSGAPSYIEQLSNNKVCVNVWEIEKRTDELLGQVKQSQEKVLGYLETLADQTPFENQEENIKDTESFNEDVMKNMERSGIPENDEELFSRSKLFEPGRKPLNHYSFEDLVVNEILAYESYLEKWRDPLKEMVETYTMWMSNRLANSFCSLAFDVDLDGELTYKEYVISIYSQIVRDVVVPKVFLSLIGPLMEDSCISPEDLRKLDHDPNTFEDDFAAVDVNGDGCFSLEEFEQSIQEICRVNWLTDFLENTGLDQFRPLLELTPEEAYIRMLKENERMDTNWNFVDTNLDGFISFEELRTDLAAMGTYDPDAEAHGLMEHFDENNDGKASYIEVKHQIIAPSFTEEYQFDWLESLYEIYEPDQLGVMEDLKNLLREHDSVQFDKISSAGVRDELFHMFDKNRNGEIDMVELKLLLEMLKKYVVHLMLELTVGSLDLDSDGKLGIHEYEQFFGNVSSNLSLYFTYLMTAQEDEIVQEIAKHMTDEGMEDDELYEETTDENGNSVVYVKLLKRAGGANETYFVHKLFRSLDTNSDGFLTKEDFYFKMRSKKIRRTDSQLEQQFLALDVDKDGVLTEKDGVEITEPLSFETFKTAVDIYAEEVDKVDLSKHMSILDSNGDSVIQLREFEVTKRTLVTSDDEEDLLDWLVDYFGSNEPSQMDPQGVKVFSEFDINCDGFISKTEFQQKVEQLRQKTEANKSSIKLSWEAEVYFNNLDLSKDGRVSYNEFDFLLLRNSARINE